MNQHAIQAAFDKAAPHYDAQADMQRDVLERLVDYAASYLPPSPDVLDVGCGTGYLKQVVLKQELDWSITSTDLAEGMCRQLNHQATFVSRMEQLPVKPNIYNSVFSSLAMQWSDDIEQTFIQFCGVLKPGGIAAVSLFVDGTLHELQQAFSSIDDKQHIRPFHSFDTIQDEMLRQGFDILMAEHNTLERTDDSLHSLMSYLKTIGAHQFDRQRKGLMTPRQFARVEAAYPKTNDSITSSWHVGYFIGRKP